MQPRTVHFDGERHRAFLRSCPGKVLACTAIAQSALLQGARVPHAAPGGGLRLPCHRLAACWAPCRAARRSPCGPTPAALLGGAHLYLMERSVAGMLRRIIAEHVIGTLSARTMRSKMGASVSGVHRREAAGFHRQYGPRLSCDSRISARSPWASNPRDGSADGFQLILFARQSDKSSGIHCIEADVRSCGGRNRVLRGVEHIGAAAC